MAVKKIGAYTRLPDIDEIDKKIMDYGLSEVKSDLGFESRRSDAVHGIGTLLEDAEKIDKALEHIPNQRWKDPSLQDIKAHYNKHNKLSPDQMNMAINQVEEYSRLPHLKDTIAQSVIRGSVGRVKNLMKSDLTHAQHAVGSLLEDAEKYDHVLMQGSVYSDNPTLKEINTYYKKYNALPKEYITMAIHKVRKYSNLPNIEEEERQTIRDNIIKTKKLRKINPDAFEPALVNNLLKDAEKYDQALEKNPITPLKGATSQEIKAYYDKHETLTPEHVATVLDKLEVYSEMPITDDRDLINKIVIADYINTIRDYYIPNQPKEVPHFISKIILDGDKAKIYDKALEALSQGKEYKAKINHNKGEEKTLLGIKTTFNQNKHQPKELQKDKDSTIPQGNSRPRSNSGNTPGSPS